ncbi:MAG: heparinase II/III domain-containing protein, partial [Opitutales bacterium]
QLLWFAPTIDEAAADVELPRTDELPFAGISLQRNVPEESGKQHGLMGFIGGGSFVHSHASGMSMELYGTGHVMGAKSGRSSYQSTIHENYYRLFASNNTVIVNGASRGDGGWQDIAINQVQRLAMEPEPFEEAVSDVFSFTCSSFEDNKGSGAEASQQRTLAIVRTSPTTGFYVDVFRSDSSLSNEYHDYIYRNIGDLNPTIEAGGTPVTLSSAPNRFQNDIGDSYEQPGWRYFTNTMTAPATTDPIRVSFRVSIGGVVRFMDMHMPSIFNRVIAQVDSPPIVDAPSPYDSRNAPAVVVRQLGEAWKNPFVSVFEPYFRSDGPSVQSTEALSEGGVVRGVKVESLVDGQIVTHYVLSNPYASQSYSNSGIGLNFTGRFGIVEEREDGTIRLYLGEGSSIQYKGNSLNSNGGSNTQAEALIVPYFDPSVRSNSAITMTEAPKQGYALWASSHAPNSLPVDDYDKDGVENVVEYVLGGSELGSDVDKLPTITQDGNRLNFTFMRSQESIDGETELQIEVGDTPGTLDDIHPVPDGPVSVEPGLTVTKDAATGYDEVTFSVEVDAAERKFIRLRVTP